MTRKEAINTVRNIYQTDKEKEALEILIPELAESEDERIRKELIGYLTHRAEVTGFIDEDKDCKRWIAYLEKQKEQKPIFKKGDKVIWDDEEFNILDVNETEYNVGGYRVPFSRQNELHPIWQKTAEWSEEDERTLESFLGWLQGSMGEKTYSSWLKSLPERFSPQPKQEWGEEDETKKERLISIVKRALHGNKYPLLNDNGATELIIWLKSLRPQPHWKPTEEQMEALSEVIGDERMEDTAACEKKAEILESLYNDLKKL
jgi:hypothetical protein